MPAHVVMQMCLDMRSIWNGWLRLFSCKSSNGLLFAESLLVLLLILQLSVACNSSLQMESWERKVWREGLRTAEAGNRKQSKSLEGMPYVDTNVNESLLVS